MKSIVQSRDECGALAAPSERGRRLPPSNEVLDYFAPSCKWCSPSRVIRCACTHTGPRRFDSRLWSLTDCATTTSQSMRLHFWLPADPPGNEWFSNSVSGPRARARSRQTVAFHQRGACGPDCVRLCRFVTDAARGSLIEDFLFFCASLRASRKGRNTRAGARSQTGEPGLLVMTGEGWLSVHDRPGWDWKRQPDGNAPLIFGRCFAWLTLPLIRCFVPARRGFVSSAFDVRCGVRARSVCLLWLGSIANGSSSSCVWSPRTFIGSSRDTGRVLYDLRAVFTAGGIGGGILWRGTCSRVAALLISRYID